MARALLIPLALAVAMLTTASSPGVAAPGNRLELEAREAFAVGDYQKAVGLFGKLYAETLHPTYLRNIGRCYQNLGDAERAISSFRDYLRKAPNLPPAERTEIEGYIAEMELLKTRKTAEPAKAAAPPPPRPAERAAHPAVTTAAPPPPAAVEEKRSGSRWWLWTALGVVAVGAAGVGAALVLSRPKDAACPAGIDCFKP